MRDEKVSLPRILLLHPLVIQDVITGINRAEEIIPQDYAIRIVQGLRTFKEQSELFALGRTKHGAKVTNANAGESFHNYGLAFDFCFMANGKDIWNVDTNWKVVVKVFKDLGWVWGGYFKSIPDTPHFDKTFGLTWQQCLDKYNKKEWIGDNKYIKI